MHCFYIDPTCFAGTPARFARTNNFQLWITDMTHHRARELSDSASLEDFFLARQPILDRSQTLAAYELLFRRANSGPANVTDDLTATASVIANLAELGIDHVAGGLQCFINVDAAALMSDFIRLLPPSRTVLEILETVKGTPELVDAVTKLAAAGYIFALDDVTGTTDDVGIFMPLATIIKIDITEMPHSELFRLSKRFLHAGKVLLAEKVETKEQYEQCLALGFTYFQGYYFARPVVLSGKKLTPSQLALVELMSLIVRDADNAAIEHCIKQDASLGLTLLQLVNSAASGSTKRITSLGQAVVILGRRGLQRWLQILLYAGGGRASDKLSPLMLMAATRGRLLELMVEKLRPGDRAAADIAFTVGIMSLLDTVFAIPMTDILKKIAVHEEVAEALLHHEGFYGDLLMIAESAERLKDEKRLLQPLAERMHFSSADLNFFQLSAFEWSSSIARPST